MTGLEGNRQIYLPRKIQDRLPKILNLKGQIDSLLPEGPVIICFIILSYFILSPQESASHPFVYSKLYTCSPYLTHCKIKVQLDYELSRSLFQFEPS